MKSGNLATNLLLEHVGTAEVAAVLRDAGCSPATVLPRGIEDAAARERGPGQPGHRRRPRPGAGRRRHRDAGGPGTCAEIETCSPGRSTATRCRPGFPEGTYVANKTGWVDRRRPRRGAGAARRPPPYVLVVCTTDDAPEETLYARNAAVSAAVWEAVDRMSRIETRHRHPVTTPLHTPFVTALRRTTTTDTVVVRVIDSDGVTGWGEAPQVWQVTGESLAGAEACVERSAGPRS